MQRSLTVLLAAATIAITGCASKQSTAMEDDAQCKAFKGEAGTVNKWCVMMNDDPVDPTITPVTWKGQKVGFCCDACKPQWANLSDAEKDATLAKTIALPPPANN